MGEHRVKNIADPITVYRVRPGPGASPRRWAAIRAGSLRALRVVLKTKKQIA